MRKSGRATKPYIAVVIGDTRLRSVVTSHLTCFYKFLEYLDIPNALAGCRAHRPQLILVGDELNPTGGFDFVRTLRTDPGFTSIPIVMLTKNVKITHQVEGYINAILSEPFSQGDLIRAVSNQVNRSVEAGWNALQPDQRQALTDSLQLFDSISDVLSESRSISFNFAINACRPLVEVVANNNFRGMLEGVREHDNYSFVHSVRVATYLVLIGSNLGLSKDEQTLLATGGLLHDVGKMTIPHEVLNKPGRLNEQELVTMRGHVNVSIEYVARCEDLPKGVLTIVAQHHERLDGKGYPNGLAGHQLNRLARIASIVDVFTALTDRRVYKPEMDAETALNLMIGEMSNQLDLSLLDLFRGTLMDIAR